jgi:hypothetical protein
LVACGHRTIGDSSEGESNVLRGDVRADAIVPAAKFNGLVVTETADEVLVYDTERHHIHHLNRTTAAVWRACDGRRVVADLAQAASEQLGAAIDGEVARFAVGKLANAGLLASPLDPRRRGAGRSRREMLRWAAAGGVALPVIASVSVPAAAFSDSCNDPCGKQSDCAVGCLNCIDHRCVADQCGLPCEGDRNCTRLHGNCTKCQWVGSFRYCQPPPSLIAPQSEARSTQQEPSEAPAGEAVTEPSPTPDLESQVPDENESGPPVGTPNVDPVTRANDNAGRR